MSVISAQKSINRVIDANFNRLKEGLRVCEDISRFIIESKPLTGRLKEVRHTSTELLAGLPCRGKLIESRNSRSDIGRVIYGRELKRKNCRDIFFANLQRVKESLRVLEEFAKIKNPKTALAFKNLRYSVYDIEKRISSKLSCL